MAAYVSLVNWTDQGIHNVKDTLTRAQQVQQLVERMGGKMTLYWTTGRYDLVAVLDFADEETANAAALTIGSQGSVRTETLRAFTAEEMQRILQKMP